MPYVLEILALAAISSQIWLQLFPSLMSPPSKSRGKGRSGKQCAGLQCPELVWVITWASEHWNMSRCSTPDRLPT